MFFSQEEYDRICDAEEKQKRKKSFVKENSNQREQD